MRRMLLSLSLSVAASVGLCANAHAKHWTVCNRTPEDLLVAIAFKDPQNQTMTEGWHSLAACRGCVVVLNYDKTGNDTVYLFAENRNHVAKFTAEHPRLCVTGNAFRINNVPGGHCERVAGFQKVTIPDWNKTLKTDLTGRVGGTGCSDTSQ